MFQPYADGGGVVGEEALRRFLREVQGETEAGADAAAKEVMAFAAEQRLLKKGGLTAEGFHRWLFSDANAALEPRRGVSFSFSSATYPFFKKSFSVHHLFS
jgi:phosphatidylinositol phospholipase C delta